MGQPLMGWQCQVVNVAGEIDPATGRPAYREVRLTVPRQSGKTTLILAVEVHRSTLWGAGQRTLYAAQDRNSSRAKWEEQCQMIARTPLAPFMQQVRRTGGETMRWPATGSSIGIAASGETSGHGQTLDLGVIDEAFAQKDERLVQAFRPAMMTRKAAQLWIVSTAGDDGSLFLKDRVEDGRARVEAGDDSGVCYFEWSAADGDDPDDPQTWWGCMPALGHTVDVDTIRADHDAMPAEEFARAYLNRWTAGGRPVIDVALWQAARDTTSSLKGLPCFAVDVTPDRSFASIAVAGWRADGRVHIELVEHRPGTEWVVSRLSELYGRWHPFPVVVDPASPAASLLVDLAASGVATETIGTREYAQACEQFYDAVTGPAPTLAHRDQPALNVAVGAARKRALGDAWAWARRLGTDVSPLVAATLARWGLVKAGRGDPQIL